MPARNSLTTTSRAVEDAFYVSVGAGVLAVQSAQVRRRELQNRLGEHLDEAKPNIDRIRVNADEGLRVLEHQVDEVLEQVEEAVPSGVSVLISRGREVGQDARSLVHGFLRPADAPAN